jgi:hypothetical protein
MSKRGEIPKPISQETVVLTQALDVEKMFRATERPPTDPCGLGLADTVVGSHRSVGQQLAQEVTGFLKTRRALC